MTVLWVERHCEYDHDTLAAAELRRLHEANAELLAALKDLVDMDDAADMGVSDWNKRVNSARTAIAKAEEVK